LALPPLPAMTFGYSLFVLTALSTPGFPLFPYTTLFRSTISGDKVTLTGAGIVKLEASQIGNDKYNPAPAVIQSFSVVAQSVPISKVKQQITTSLLPAMTIGASPFVLTAFSSSGLPATYK